MFYLKKERKKISGKKCISKDESTTCESVLRKFDYYDNYKERFIWARGGAERNLHRREFETLHVSKDLGQRK